MNLCKAMISSCSGILFLRADEAEAALFYYPSISDGVTMVTCQPASAGSSLKINTHGNCVWSLISHPPLQRCCWTQAGPGARPPRARPCASWRSLTRRFHSWCGAAFAHLSSVPPARPAGTRTKTARRTFPSPRFYLEKAGTVVF